MSQYLYNSIHVTWEDRHEGMSMSYHDVQRAHVGAVLTHMLNTEQVMQCYVQQNCTDSPSENLHFCS